MFGLSLAVGEQFGGDGILDVVEAVSVSVGHGVGYRQFRQFLSVNAECGLSSLVGGGKSAEQAQSLGLSSTVGEHVLDKLALLGVSVGLTLVVAGRRSETVERIVSRLALLFACCHKVDGAFHEGGLFAVAPTHLALGVTFRCLLIPVAGIAGMVDAVEGLQHQPLSGMQSGMGILWLAGLLAAVDGEEQPAGVHWLDTV